MIFLIILKWINGNHGRSSHHDSHVYSDGGYYFGDDMSRVHDDGAACYDFYLLRHMQPGQQRQHQVSLPRVWGFGEYCRSDL